MITSEVFRGRRYAVLGLARSGVATVDALLASGAEVVAWDEREEARAEILPGTGRGTAREASGGGGLERVPELPDTARAPNPLHHPADGPPPRPGEELEVADPLTLDLKQFDAVVVSPGIPLNTHPIAHAARAAGVPLIGDIELFAQARASLPPHKVVGITGTNGKSTTTALIHHILEAAGVPTTMGGNIGLPILAQEPLPEGGVYVLELSSYQIDLTQSLDCDVAVLLNVTPDHLDRYGSLDAYKASKERLFKMQGMEGVALRYPRPYGELDQFPALRGPHNHQNVAAASAVADLLRIGAETVKQAMKTFKGLPHRMEQVGNRDGVLFVNDSKATNPDAAAPALAAFDVVHWIVGGRAKGADLDACLPQIGHVRAAYAIGEAGSVFARILEDLTPVHDCGNLEVAVREAAAAAKPGEVVLLSPAAASFDQFRDFEARGDAFRAAVEALGPMDDS